MVSCSKWAVFSGCFCKANLILVFFRPKDLAPLPGYIHRCFVLFFSVCLYLCPFFTYFWVEGRVLWSYSALLTRSVIL